MALSVAAGRPVECDRCGTFADGLAVRVAVPLAVEELVRLGTRFVQVSERAIAGRWAPSRRPACAWRGRRARRWPRSTQLEHRDGPVVLIVTGHNIDDELHRRAVEEPESFPD